MFLAWKTEPLFCFKNHFEIDEATKMIKNMQCKATHSTELVMQVKTLYRVSTNQISQEGQTFFSRWHTVVFHQINNKGNFSQYNYYKNICLYKMLHVLTPKHHHQVHINEKKGCHISWSIIFMKEICLTI
jgi:hypothetical protein